MFVEVDSRGDDMVRVICRSSVIGDTFSLHISKGDGERGMWIRLTKAELQEVQAEVNRVLPQHLAKAIEIHDLERLLIERDREINTLKANIDKATFALLDYK